MTGIEQTPPPSLTPGTRVRTSADTEEFTGECGIVIRVVPDDDPDGPWGPWIIHVRLDRSGLTLAFSPHELMPLQTFADQIEADLAELTRKGNTG